MGEMPKAADYFQAVELFEHSVEQFLKELRVGNLVERRCMRTKPGCLCSKRRRWPSFRRTR